MEEAYELKKLRYAELVDEAEDQGWKVEVWPVEVGCTGFVAGSTSQFLRQVDVRRQAFRKAVKAIANSAERNSHLLWLKRRDPVGLPSDQLTTRLTTRPNQSAVGRLD